MNFRKNSKRALTPPPPSFRKTILRFFREILKSATIFFGLEFLGTLLIKYQVCPVQSTRPKCHLKYLTKLSVIRYSASHRFILIRLLYCPSHRLLCIDISFPCLLCLLSLFLFYFFTATRDFHSADSWADSWTVVNCPRYREI